MEIEEMEVIVARAAGLDVHKDSISACVRVTKPDGTVARHKAKFGTVTAELLRMPRLARQPRRHPVGMEATGVYWKAPFYAIEDVTECWLSHSASLAAACRGPSVPVRLALGQIPP